MLYQFGKLVNRKGQLKQALAAELLHIKSHCALEIIAHMNEALFRAACCTKSVVPCQMKVALSLLTLREGGAGNEMGGYYCSEQVAEDVSLYP